MIYEKPSQFLIPPFCYCNVGRRNHMLSSHRKDDLIEWLKNLLKHSFVLDAKGSYADTMSHFEELVEEHRKVS